MSKNLVIIACSIFRIELEKLKKEGKIGVPVIYINSMLHMKPAALNKLLDERIEKYHNSKIILLFGDCHARMVDYEENANITRTPGINCCEILLGKDGYRKIRNEGSFILLPEWASRWKEVFINEMGFQNKELFKPFMREMHKKLVYIDTGIQKNDNTLLQEIEDFTGLPLEIHPCATTELENVLTQLINNAKKTELK